METPQEILIKYWQHSQFRDPQEAIINTVLKGEDTVVLLPTSGGKSICYQVPALLLEGVCIVISPLIALIKDQVNSLKEKNIKYPVCLAGERACPPEDCGGVWGYEKLLAVLQNPKDEEYESMVEWLSGWYGKYDPEKFDKEKIKFDNPKTRWNKCAAIEALVKL